MLGYRSQHAVANVTPLCGHSVGSCLCSVRRKERACSASSIRADRVDAKVAATLLEETVDVHRLGVGLDGGVLWAVRRCVRYDKCGNCPESETSVSIWMNIMGVAV